MINRDLSCSHNNINLVEYLIKVIMHPLEHQSLLNLLTLTQLTTYD